MESIYFALGVIAIIVIIHWAMIADRAGDPYRGLLAMRRPAPKDAGPIKPMKARVRRAGASSR